MQNFVLCSWRWRQALRAPTTRQTAIVAGNRNRVMETPRKVPWGWDRLRCTKEPQMPDLQRPLGRSLGPWRGGSPLLWPPPGAWPDLNARGPRIAHRPAPPKHEICRDPNRQLRILGPNSGKAHVQQQSSSCCLRPSSSGHKRLVKSTRCGKQPSSAHTKQICAEHRNSLKRCRRGFSEETHQKAWPRCLPLLWMSSRCAEA